MSKCQIARGSTSVIRHIFVQDSSSIEGAGLTGLSYSAFSCRYIRPGETLSGAITPQDIATLGTYAAPTANTNIRIKEVDATNAPGLYEIQIHDDWLNITNSRQMLTILLSATGMAPLPFEIELEAIDRNSQAWKEAIEQIITGTVTGSPTTTTIPASGFGEATSDHYYGRAMLFTSGDLDGQATDITAYTTGSFTVTALTEAPSADDTFIIV